MGRATDAVYAANLLRVYPPWLLLQVVTHAYGVRESGRHMGTTHSEVWIIQVCSVSPASKTPEGSSSLRRNGAGCRCEGEAHLLLRAPVGLLYLYRHAFSDSVHALYPQDLCTLGSLLRAIERGLFTREDGKPRVLSALLTVRGGAGGTTGGCCGLVLAVK